MIRFGVVNPDDEVVYNNSNCQLKVNSGETARGTLLMTNRSVYRSASLHLVYYNCILVRFAGSDKTQRMDL